MWHLEEIVKRNSKGTQDGPSLLAAHVVEELQRKAAVLDALKAHGVDNWEGYGEAMASLEEDEAEEAP